ncbi:MAG: hypothetical protein ACYSW3_28290 [Planctomycetota bacterium]|jgi:hypothetical protein
MNNTQKCERLFELIAPQIHPRLARSLKVKIKPQSSYIYEARKNGSGVKLQVNFYPGQREWEPRFKAGLAAVMQILDGRTNAVAIRQLTPLEWSLVQYRRELQLANAGYFLPRREDVHEKELPH